ncbi:hypothetical protein F4009_13925, partial [Candidatus Poribacteria bacterium]|nr:hypothetical protein [Candidatus Poribacteria bacterium]MYK95072.1 hypothetical protein [Candidatus Poribacteria bacterium]
EVTITPQPKSDGSDGDKVVTTTGTDGFLMHIDAKDVREGTVLLSESAARGGDNMYTGILKYDRLATLPITLSVDPNDLVAGSKPDVDAVTATVGEGGDTPSPTNAPAKPAAPTAVTNATNDLSIDVSWTAPDDNGSAITGYTVRKYNSADELVKTFPDDDPNTNVITGTSYTVGPVPESDRGMFFTFTVAATNTNGTSEESDKSVAYTVVAPITWNLDVNRDGRVDVLDLVLVAVFHGTRMNGLAADVNADGIVNVQDFAAVAAGVDTANALALQAIEEVLLVAIAQAGDLEKAAEAPMRFNTPPEALSLSIAYENVTEAFIETRRIAVTDVRLTETVALLETLLMLLTEMRAIPETTALLPNYPNPFNPETWIPYHLAKDAEVTLTIYSVRGVAVRELTLGHQTAGVYQSKHRAAYWDGKNQLGEKVASGVYFYTLSTESTRGSVTVGDFTATRKMLIAK